MVDSDEKYSSVAAGKSGGLQLLLNAQMDEYKVGPSSFSEGCSVSIKLSFLLKNFLMLCVVRLVITFYPFIILILF